MTFKKLTPVIYTSDIEGTVDYYVNVFGFVCLANEPDWGWARVELDSVAFMISKPNEHIPFDKAIFTGSFYINTDSVDVIWDKLKYKANVCYPMEDFEYGMREFAVYDNNGYLIQFGQDIA